MKKIIISILLVSIIGFLLAFAKKQNDYLLEYFTKAEVDYIEENDIEFDDIYPYLKYQRFNIYDFYSYEAIKETVPYCNYLEAINIYYNLNYYTAYVNTCTAPFLNQFNVLVNKHYYLEKDYIANDLDYLENYSLNYIKRESEQMQGNITALESLVEMQKDASKYNIELVIYSGYRSYERQEYLYYDVNLSNDNYSARPGHSEHQTGLAFDISDYEHGLTENFKNSENYEWLINNSYLYGFILRYPQDKETMTLYNYEPWHFRYVGKSIATYMYNNNYCLEECIIKNYEL